MPATVTKTQVYLARIAMALIVTFAVAGLLWYGFAADERARLWQNLFERKSGPMTFRYFLQPTMGTIAAWRAGLQDARTGRSPFLWGAITDPAERRARFDEAMIATSRIILLGLAMDIVYQAIVFRTFFPGEAVIFALALAFVPYVLLRGLFARGARWWWDRQKGATR
jgi:hypothetical protein